MQRRRILVLYVAARLAFPDSSEPQDLRKYYASIQGRLWMLVAAFFATALLVNVWLIGTPPLVAPETEKDTPEILQAAMQKYADNIAEHIARYPCHISKS